MPIGLVFNTSKAGTNGSGTHTTGLDSTGSSLIVMVTGGFGSIVNPTDSKGNTWTKLTQQSTSTDDPDAAIYYAAGPLVVGTGHTFDDTASFQPMCVAGFSGVSIVSPFDQQNGAVGTVLTSKQPGSVTPTQNGELIISALMWNGSISNQAIDSSLSITNTVAFSSGVTYGASLAWYTQPAAAAINPTWSWTTNTAKVAAMIATFKAAGGANTLLLMGVG